MVIHWIVFGVLLGIIPIGIFSLYFQTTKKNKPTPEQQKIASVNIVKYILFYWLCDFFYMVSFNHWLIAQFILGGTVMIIIFNNLATIFVNTKLTNNFQKFGLIQDFVIAVGISIYLIYIVSNKELQTILIPIVAAIYGGLLTLVGVAWTIKSNNIENRRQDKLKYRPIIIYQDIRTHLLKEIAALHLFTMVVDPEIIKYYIFKNIGEKPFEIKINTLTGTTKWVQPNETFVLGLGVKNTTDVIQLEINDVLKNRYIYQITFTDIFEIKNLDCIEGDK